MVSASPAGAGLVMSLDSGRVVVGAGGVGEEGAGHLLALSFDAVAGTDLGGQTCGCVSAEVDRRAAGDRVAQMSVQLVECSALAARYRGVVVLVGGSVVVGVRCATMG